MNEQYLPANFLPATLEVPNESYNAVDKKCECVLLVLETIANTNTN